MQWLLAHFICNILLYYLNYQLWVYQLVSFAFLLVKDLHNYWVDHSYKIRTRVMLLFKFFVRLLLFETVPISVWYLWHEKNVIGRRCFYNFSSNLQFGKENLLITSSILGSISWWICIRAKPIKQSSTMVLLLYVFSLLNAENSHSHDVTDRVAKMWREILILSNPWKFTCLSVAVILSSLEPWYVSQ